MAKKKQTVKSMEDPREQKHGVFYYAMPWNLKKEIELYGYSFSAKQMLLVYAVVTVVSLVLGKLFKLAGWWYLPLVFFGLLFSPKLIRNRYRNKYEFARFSDVNVYVEQMLYAFKNSQKVLTALHDVQILFPAGTAMRQVIDEACATIERPDAKNEGDGERRGLAIIEKRYPNVYIKDLHTFMLRVERIGGNFDASISLLLDSRAMWENRMLKLKDKRKEMRTQILISCLVSLGICALIFYILPQEVDISANPVVRVCDVVAILACFLIYTKADTKLASNLITTEKTIKDSEMVKKYHRYLNYNPKKEFMTSLVYSIVPAIFLVIGLLFKNKWMTVICAVLTCFMLCQHAIGHNVLGKSLRKEISRAFPQWLMELALLLQSDNVQVSIFKTIHDAAPIMRPELERFRKAITLHPDSSEPFLNFFQEFQMPEITTSMQMLYSLSVGSGGDSNEQISNIVHRNNVILDRAEELANDNSMASLNLLFLMPVVVGGAVLMVDMTMFLLAFMNSMGV